MRSSAWRRSTSGSGQSGYSCRKRQVAAKSASLRGATRSTDQSTMRTSSGLLKLATAARASAKRLSSTALKATASAAASPGLRLLGWLSAWDISLLVAGGPTPLPLPSRAIGRADVDGGGMDADGREVGPLEVGPVDGVRRTPMSG